jgi:hypothetical protein
MALRRTVTQFQRRVLQARYLQASRHPDRAPKTKRSESDHDRVGEGKYESGHAGVGISVFFFLKKKEAKKTS